MTNYPSLETSRLILKPLARNDAKSIQTLLPDWEIVKYLSKEIPWPYPDMGAMDYIEKVALPAIHEGKLWSWTLRIKTAPDKTIGVIELMKSKSVNRAFWLAREWQGKGYMTEAIEAANEFWFDVLGNDILRTSKARANTSSVALSKRTGMRFIGYSHADFLSGNNLETECWEMTKAEWKEHRERRRSEP